MDRRAFLAGTTVSTAFAAALPVSAARRSPARDAVALALVTAAADQQAAAILSKGALAEVGSYPRATLRRMRRLVAPLVWP